MKPETPVVMDISNYRATGFNRGAGILKEGLWLVTSFLIFQACPFSFSPLKRFILRVFGARIGKNVTIKPQVKITFPWKLVIGDHVWLGEECWLLNLERISIGSNVCISQRAMLCTGSHNYKLSSFDLIVRPIIVMDGCWIGANAWVGPGVTVETHAVLAAGSVTGKSLEPYGVYRGNPALRINSRVISQSIIGRDKHEHGRA